MKSLVLALFAIVVFTGCAIPYKDDPGPSTRKVPGHATYPSVPIEAPAAYAAYSSFPVDLTAHCAEPGDCEALVCPGPCEAWECVAGVCELGSRRGRLCIRGHGRDENVGVCNNVGECEELR